MFFKTRKRLDAMEREIGAIRDEIDTLRNEIGEMHAAALNTDGRESLSKTLNEWVWGKEGEDES